MLDVIWLIPAFPLLGFLLILLFGRRLGEPASGYLASAMVLASFVVAAGAYADLLSMGEEERFPLSRGTADTVMRCCADV